MSEKKEPNPKAKDYYERLGVEKKATHAEIRKAYMKCVRIYHPDHNPTLKDNGAAFSRISEAYEVLKDGEKRDIYDDRGEEGLKNGGMGRGGFDIFDLIHGRRGGGGGGGRRSPGPKKCQSVKQGLPCTLENLYNGATRKMRVTRTRVCKDCKGTGATKKGMTEECDQCNGTGVETRYQRLGIGFVTQVRQQCSKCHGEKLMIHPKYRCKGCVGKRVIQEKKTLEIHIDKGMKHGQVIEFEGEADEKPGFKAGDIIFVLQQKPHKMFQRQGGNLVMKKKIKLVASLTGVEFSLKSLDDRTLVVKSKPGEVIKHNGTKIVKGEGMPTYKRPYEKGDLFISFQVEFPSTIPKEFFDKLIKCLPPKKKVDLKEEDKEEVEEFILTDPDFTKGQGGRRKEAYEEDDEDGYQRSGETVSCSVQ